MENLTPQQRQTVEQFLEITALGNEGTPQAIQYLQSVNWNSDQAIQNFFSGITPEAAQPNAPPQRQEQNGRGRNGRPRFSNKQPELIWPLNVLEAALNTLLGIGPPESVQDAFQRIGITSCPNFQARSFRKTLRLARDQKKMVCIYFHSPNHDDTNIFLQALASPEVCQFMDNNFLNQGINVQTPEGYRLESRLKIKTYPALIVGEAQSSNKFAAHGLFVGLATPEKILEFLNSKHDSFLAIQAQRMIQEATRNQDRQMRVNQDDDYDRLLQEAAQKKKEEEEKRLLQQKEEEEEERKLEEVQAVEEWRETVRSQAEERLPPEPAKEDPHLLVKIRLPSGTTVERRFRKTDIIEDVRNFVQSHELKTIEQEYVDDFILLEPFPRKLYDNDEQTVEKAFGRCRVAKLVCQEVCETSS